MFKKKYKFLFKPVFYICSLLLSSWIVMEIENYNPPDKSVRNELKTANPKRNIVEIHSAKCLHEKECLLTLFRDYKSGLIDSTTFDNELEKYIHSTKQIFAESKE